jgi:excisionase family DNA binding protein
LRGDCVLMKSSETQLSQPSPPDRFLTTNEILERLRVSRRTLFSHRESGKIPHIRLGGRILFDWPTVRETLLRQHTADSAKR